MKNILKRLKSPVVWLAVISQIAIIVALYNPQISEDLKLVGGVIVEIFTLFGILNNPTNKEGF